MRLVIPLLFIAFQVSAQVPQEVPRHRDPEVPSKSSLDALKPLSIDEVEVELIYNEDREGLRFYHLNGKAFSGWLFQELDDELHKYRYLLIEDGNVTWQIGFWDNGNLDCDFHMLKDKGWGSHRMWKRDGSPYINDYYSEPGLRDGIQRRWNGNGDLVYIAEYEDGKLVSEGTPKNIQEEK